jgi:hypothetical protein
MEWKDVRVSELRCDVDLLYEAIRAKGCGKFRT